MNLQNVRDTIDRALDAAGLTRASTGGTADAVRSTIDHALRKAGLVGTPDHADAIDTMPAVDDTVPAPEVGERGAFSAHLHSSVHGNRAYKLYVPSSASAAPRPLVLMLHGCTQDPDDFAAGTRMNELAERHDLLVAYPAQSKRANGNACWNWFEATQQQRGGAELSLLVGIVDDVARQHAVDASRVYVAGLSAGAAMAVLLGREYPDRFAAVASHSGLPAGAAHDVASAFAAMQGRAQAVPTSPAPAPAVRTLVIHGDADTTVHPRNGATVALQAVAAFEREGLALTGVIEDATGGRRATVTRHVDTKGLVAVEQWLVHGAGHAWAGGSAAGSYTDPQAPDASAAMLRFFLRH